MSSRPAQVSPPLRRTWPPSPVKWPRGRDRCRSTPCTATWLRPPSRSCRRRAWPGRTQRRSSPPGVPRHPPGSAHRCPVGAHVRLNERHLVLPRNGHEYPHPPYSGCLLVGGLLDPGGQPCPSEEHRASCTAGASCRTQGGPHPIARLARRRSLSCRSATAPMTSRLPVPSPVTPGAVIDSASAPPGLAVSPGRAWTRPAAGLHRVRIQGVGGPPRPTCGCRAAVRTAPLRPGDRPRRRAGGPARRRTPGPAGSPDS